MAESSETDSCFLNSNRFHSEVLLDRQGPASLRDAIRDSVEADADSRIAELHFWSVGPAVYAAGLSVVAHHPGSPEQYRARLPRGFGLSHVSIEVQRCAEGAAGSAEAGAGEAA